MIQGRTGSSRSARGDAMRGSGTGDDGSEAEDEGMGRWGDACMEGHWIARAREDGRMQHRRQMG